jgi:hypothetical protein
MQDGNRRPVAEQIDNQDVVRAVSLMTSVQASKVDPCQSHISLRTEEFSTPAGVYSVLQIDFVVCTLVSFAMIP